MRERQDRKEKLFIITLMTIKKVVINEKLY